MTRAQAQRIADKIVAAARAANRDDPNGWTSVTLPTDCIGKPTPEADMLLQMNTGLIVGCLPMGWRLVGYPAGSFSVRRPL